MPKSDLDKIQSENLKNFLKWAKSNSKKLRPDDKKIKIFYADRMINMSDLGKKVKEIEKKNGDKDLGPHVAKIESYVKHITTSSMNGKESNYASIETMCTKWKKPLPDTIDPKTGKPGKFKNLYDYAMKTAGRGTKEQFLASTNRGEIWSTLSSIYAQNTKGEIMILESGLNDVKDAFKTSDLIRKELAKLSKNKQLSKASSNEVKKVMESYLKRYEKAVAGSKEEMEKAYKILTEGAP